MKLEKILDNLGSLEKNSFIKIVDGLLQISPNKKEIEKLLNSTDKTLKASDSSIIVKVFNLLEPEFEKFLREEFLNVNSQFDILIDIIIRDGRCILKQDWFSRLYENEIKSLKQKVKELGSVLHGEEIADTRIRDYKIYSKCLETAYYNDEINNRDKRITDDELSILISLSKALSLSQEETKLINYLILPIEMLEIQAVIDNLKNLGIAFYSKKLNTVFIADEIVRILRNIRNKEIADKFARRILKSLKEPQINQICRLHNIDRKPELKVNIDSIISEGVSFREILMNDIYKGGISVTDKKKFLNEFCLKNFSAGLKGSTMDDKIDSLFEHFELVEKDEKVHISLDGYLSLLNDLSLIIPSANAKVRKELECQEEHVLNSEYLLDRNIKPLDVLDLFSKEELEMLCTQKGIKIRGDIYENILASYTDSDNLFIENYIHIGCRDLDQIKSSGLTVKESDLGMKYEEITKEIFKQLGFQVDDALKNSLNTNKDKMDIILNLGNNELIIVECKTVKENNYNKFSSVSRQMKSYYELAERNGYKVIKSLLVAPSFSDDFISECEIEFSLNLSLLPSESLYYILQEFKQNSKHNIFPYNLFMRDILISHERAIKALRK